jgi:hypothetical protein
MPVYEIMPRDLLQVHVHAKDPHAAGPFGLARWPLPGSLFHALHAVLHQTYPQIQLWEHNHSTGANGRYLNRGVRLQRFGALATAGPFPRLQNGTTGSWLFPRPADSCLAGLPAGASALSVLPSAVQSLAFDPAEREPGRPALSWEVASPDAEVGSPLASNSREGYWLTKAGIEDYLRGQPLSGDCWRTDGDLFSIEACGRRRGRAGAGPREPESQGEPLLLRLHDPVSLAGHARLPLSGPNQPEGLAMVFDAAGRTIFFGGGGRLAIIQQREPEGLEHWLPVSAPVTGPGMKWLLLAPAIFPPQTQTGGTPGKPHPGGWLPNWVCPDSGQVLLRRQLPVRGDSHRAGWRKLVRLQPPLDCRLAAVSLPALTHVGGWSARRHLVLDYTGLKPGPKPVWQAVPAGAVYYFTGPDAPLLADALAWHGTERQNIRWIHHRRSTVMGEQGYGLGVCGPWEQVKS